MNDVLKNILLSIVMILSIIIFGIVGKSFQAMNMKKHSNNTGTIIKKAQFDIKNYLNSNQLVLIASCDSFFIDLNSQIDTGRTIKYKQYFDCLHPNVQLKCYGSFSDVILPEDDISHFELKDTDSTKTLLYAKIVNNAMFGKILEDEKIHSCISTESL